jgi:hypothetical protein
VIFVAHLCAPFFCNITRRNSHPVKDNEKAAAQPVMPWCVNTRRHWEVTDEPVWVMWLFTRPFASQPQHSIRHIAQHRCQVLLPSLAYVNNKFKCKCGSCEDLIMTRSAFYLYIIRCELRLPAIRQCCYTCNFLPKDCLCWINGIQLDVYSGHQC